MENEERLKSTMGIHLIVDCLDCDVDKVTSTDNFREFVKTLESDAGLDKRLFSPFTGSIQQFPETENHESGYMYVQSFVSASLTANFGEVSGFGYIDLIAFRDIDVERVVEIIETYYNPGSIKYVVLNRGDWNELDDEGMPI